MKIAQTFIIGASYICLFRSKITRVKATGALASAQQTCSMSDEKCAADEKYEVGSSSVAFVTTPDATSAKNIAHGLLNQKLAACVNLLPQITSIYHWEGKINEDEEVLLMIKTRTSRVEELTKYVKENHPYSVAEVITLPIENGNLPYLKWIHNTVPEKQ